MPEVLQSKTAGQSLSSIWPEVPERHSDTEEVTGSNPVRPTIFVCLFGLLSDYAVSVSPLGTLTLSVISSALETRSMTGHAAADRETIMRRQTISVTWVDSRLTVSLKIE